MQRRKSHEYKVQIPFSAKAKYFGFGAVFSPGAGLSLLFYGWQTSLFTIGLFIVMWFLIDYEQE